MIKRVVVASIAALLAASPAFAEDGAGFTGFYVGAITGYDRVGGEDGVAFGVNAGYDLKAGSAILGIEGEAADSTASGGGASAKRDLYIGGRIGGEISPGLLLYLKGGYTNARIGCGSGCGANFEGFRAGLGFEYQVNANIFVKTEYRYSDYRDGLERHQGIAGVGFRF